MIYSSTHITKNQFQYMKEVKGTRPKTMIHGHHQERMVWWMSTLLTAMTGDEQNASRRSRVGVGKNRSARGGNKCKAL